MKLDIIWTLDHHCLFGQHDLRRGKTKHFSLSVINSEESTFLFKLRAYKLQGYKIPPICSKVFTITMFIDCKKMFRHPPNDIINFLHFENVLLKFHIL